MISAYANLSGARITKASITIPYYGIWTAVVTMAQPFTAPTPCTLSVADMTLTGFVYRSDQFAGLQIAQLIGGFGGWGKTLSAKKYGSPGGVKVSLVLGDAALECGEQVALSQDATIGTFYGRDAGPASNVLRDLAGALWWIDPKGVTQCGTARSALPITSKFMLTDFDPGVGLITAATENPSDWMPGRTVSTSVLTTPRTLSLVRHEVDNDGNFVTEALAA